MTELTTPSPATGAEVFEVIYSRLIRAGLLPINIRVLPDFQTLCLQMENDRPDLVDRTLAVLGMVPGNLVREEDGEIHLIGNGSDAFAQYGVKSRFRARQTSPLLEGWALDVDAIIHVAHAVYAELTGPAATSPVVDLAAQRESLLAQLAAVDTKLATAEVPA